MLAKMQQQQAAFQAAAQDPESPEIGLTGPSTGPDGDQAGPAAASLPECVLCSQETEAEGTLCWLVSSYGVQPHMLDQGTTCLQSKVHVLESELRSGLNWDWHADAAHTIRKGTAGRLMRPRRQLLWNSIAVAAVRCPCERTQCFSHKGLCQSLTLGQSLQYQLSV